MDLGKAMGFEQVQCAELDCYLLTWTAEKEHLDLCNSSLVWDLLHRVCKQLPTIQEISACKATVTLEKTSDLSHILALPCW